MADNKDKPRIISLKGATIGGEGWDRFSWEPYKKWPSRGQRILEFFLMQNFDPTVGAALYVLRRMITNALGKYKHEREEIATFVNGALAMVNSGETSVAMAGAEGLAWKLLTAPGYGVALAETTWKHDANAWLYDRIELLHPLTYAGDILGGIFIGDKQKNMPGIKWDSKKQQITEVVQASGEMFETPTRIPIDRLIYWPYDQQFREDLYGNSLLNRARRGWHAKTKMEQYWMVLLEKWSTPVPIVTLPANLVWEDPDTGEAMELSKFVQEFLTELVAGKGMILPMTDADAGIFKMELLESKQAGYEAYEKACTYWDEGIFLAVLMARLLLKEPEHASRAQAETMLQFFLMLLDGIAAELGAVLVNQVCQPLVDYNFGTGITGGEWVFDDFRESDMEQMSKVFLTIAQAQQAADMGNVDVGADMEKARGGWASGILASPEEKAEYEAAHPEEEFEPETEPETPYDRLGE